MMLAQDRPIRKMVLSSLPGPFEEQRGIQTDKEQNVAGQLGANMGSSKDDQMKTLAMQTWRKSMRQAICPPLESQLNPQTKTWIAWVGIN
jgi:hypothetical protein